MGRGARRADKLYKLECLQRERDAWTEIVRNCQPCHATTCEGQKSLCGRLGCEGSRHYAVACPVMKAARRQRDARRGEVRRGDKNDGASDSTDAPSDTSTVAVTKPSNAGLTDRKLAAHQSALLKLTPAQVIDMKQLTPSEEVKAKKIERKLREIAKLEEKGLDNLDKKQQEKVATRVKLESTLVMTKIRCGYARC